MQNRAKLTRQYLSASAVIAAAGDPFNFEYIMPSGYNYLAQVLFDPDKDAIINLYSQKLKTNILQDFSTKIGSALGVIDIGSEELTGDIMRIGGNLYDAAAFPARITITLAFQ